MNQLYYGDNLDVLRRHIRDESVDLVYLDPPFNSSQDYNVLFKEKDGTDAASQFKAFEDTWEWNQASAQTYQEVVEAGGRVSLVMQAFRQFFGTNDMLAYLTMMAPRLAELWRVLKPTGSLYLHCDPTASHYLKMLLDAVFGPRNFRNEIAWRRSRGHSDKTLSKFGANHDIILYYAKNDAPLFNRQHHERASSSPKTHDLYTHSDGKLYRKGDCIAPGGRGPKYEWNGFIRNWRFTQEKRRELEELGLIVYSKNGMPRVLRPVEPTRGHPLQDTWTDIDPPNSGSGEKLDYPTQKPEALLERIIKASSNEGDTVLDPFCGCGTAIAVAQRLNRNWIGIDITHLAIGLIKNRLRDHFTDEVAKTYQVIGEPVSLPDAQQLAKEDPFQFQWWALGLVQARPIQQKKGADRGIDGRLYFHDEENGTTKQVILSVKSGHVSVKDVRDLRGVIERERAQIGVLITLEEQTKPMLAEAAAAGFYKSPWGNHPRLQILTITELLDGKRIDYPPTLNVTHKRAPRHLPEPAAQHALPLADEPESLPVFTEEELSRPKPIAIKADGYDDFKERLNKKLKRKDKKTHKK